MKQPMKRREFLIKGAAVVGGAATWSLMSLGSQAEAKVAAASPAGKAKTHSPWVVKPVRRGKVESFDLADVTLLPSPFLAAMERDRAYLLSLEPDRFLHNFRTEAGLLAKAAIYGGWESAGVAGQTLGHYMSALALHYRATGDTQIKKRLAYIVGELALCQDKNGGGYVSGIPDGKAMFADVAAGKGDGLMRGWVPWYTTHKVMAGLRDAYLYTGNPQAKEVLLKLSDWAIATTSALSAEQWQIMLGQEHGGMNEVLADVYAMTGDKKYLTLADKFYQKSVLDPLTEREDKLAGLHGNTQVPKLIGLARIYELTGDAKSKTAAEFFWDRVIHTRTYAIGGNTEDEHFSPAGELSHHLGPVTAETCNTYNMLKLTRHLFEWTTSPEYADYYERALYNHILASQDPKRGMMTYYVSLRPGHFKTYSEPTDSFWCCVGTGMENHVKYGDSIYFHDASSLYVNLFIPSVLRWHAKGLTVKQETRFPESDNTRLTLTCPKPVTATLRVRCPSWSRGMTVAVNGKPVKVAAKPGSYVSLPGTWKSGDVVDITLPMHLYTEGLPDDESKVAVLYGPIVLAGQLGKVGLKPPIPYARDAGAYFGVSDPAVPVLVTNNRPVQEWIRPVAGHALTFETHGVGRPNDVTLKPFYTTYYDRYTVYWDTFTPAQWAQREAAYKAEKARLAELNARTVDEMRPGEQQPEHDHNLQSANSRTGSGPVDSGHWRDATDGGWFAFDLKTIPDTPQDLICTYWGSDSGNRVFDISLDGTVIATQSLNADKPGQTFDVVTPLPAALVASKDKVTIKFQAKPGATAGGLFGCRIVRRQL